MNTSYFYVSLQWRSLTLFSFPFSEVLLTALPVICVIFVSAESIEHRTLTGESGWFWLLSGYGTISQRIKLTCSPHWPYPWRILSRITVSNFTLETRHACLSWSWEAASSLLSRGCRTKQFATSMEPNCPKCTLRLWERGKVLSKRNINRGFDAGRI